MSNFCFLGVATMDEKDLPFWKTVGGNIVQAPLDLLVRSSISSSREEEENLLAALLDHTSNLPRILRFIVFVAVFFITRSPFYAFLASCGAYLLGYLNYFHRDNAVLAFIKLYLSDTYSLLLKLFIPPIAVVLIAIFTKHYFLILFYLASLIFSFIANLVIIRICRAITVKTDDVALTPVDLKAIRYGYLNFRRSGYNKPYWFYRSMVAGDIKERQKFN